MGDILDRDTLARLAEPFRSDQVRWKPQVISDSGNALAVAYVDPRVVSERLDLAVGGDWSFHWEPLGIQGDRLVVKSSLTIRGVTREDVGEYVLSDREQADPWKSAVSDALKRAAVHFGVGRYLYWLEAIWCAYDRRRHEFIDEPYIDDEGHARVRHRQPEVGRPSGEGQARERRERAGSRPQSAREPGAAAAAAGTGRQTGRVREPRSNADYGVSWGEDFMTWTARYLEHQHVSSAPADQVLAWLAKQGEIHADLAAYSALTDAQAAVIRGLPRYIESHTDQASPDDRTGQTG
ncbi:MAG: hypothetical protein GXX94_10800 [Chloroflexi bacterium]|nr:hypothetical protein [Chloroflexota bacterium]